MRLASQRLMAPHTSVPIASQRLRLAVVLPAFNEALNLPRAVAQALEAAAFLPPGVILNEIIVVNDGSTDDTAEVVDHLCSADHRVRLHTHERQRGLGAAIRTGLAASRSDLVVYTDSDVPVRLSEIGPAIQLALNPGVGLVAGYRHNMDTDGRRRRIYSTVYRALIRGALRLRVRDVNFALKVITADALTAIELVSDRSFIDAELVARVAAAGYLVEEAGFDYQPRIAGESTLASSGEIVALVREGLPLILPLRRSMKTNARRMPRCG